MGGEGSIDVVDSGESCGPDDSGVDCSVVGVGAGAGGAPPVLLALFMGLLGLVALRLRRNG
jgi:MYXO-CTERM domain-containing protein